MLAEVHQLSWFSEPILVYWRYSADKHYHHQFRIFEFLFFRKFVCHFTLRKSMIFSLSIGESQGMLALSFLRPFLACVYAIFFCCYSTVSLCFQVYKIRNYLASTPSLHILQLLTIRTIYPSVSHSGIAFHSSCIELNLSANIVFYLTKNWGCV